jgi:hypothetical protein
MDLRRIAALAKHNYDSLDAALSIQIEVKPASSYGASMSPSAYALWVCKSAIVALESIFETNSITLEGPKETLNVEKIKEGLASKRTEQYLRDNIEHLRIQLDGTTLVRLGKGVRKVPKLMNAIMYFNSYSNSIFIESYRVEWLINYDEADSRYGESWDYEKMRSDPDIEGILFKENAIPLCEAIGKIYAEFGSDIKPGGTTNPDTDNIFINLAKRLAKK